MGEYARHNGQEIKIGTCEDMYYLRLEDIFKITPLANSLDPTTCPGLRFRLPFPDEDDVQIGHYENYNRGLRLYRQVKDHMGRERSEDYAPVWLADRESGRIQLTHPSGLLISVPCHHGVKLPEVGPDTTVHWNGKSHALELSSVKTLPDGSVVPVVRCRHCDHAWRTTWEDVLPFVADPVLHDRLAKHAPQLAEAA